MAKRKPKVKGCHGHGGKCKNPPVVMRGLARWCEKCDEVPKPEKMPRHSKAAKIANAVAKLRVRDYDDPHNRVAREAD